MRVLLSARVYDNQVGGNTRYVRSVYDGLRDLDVDVTMARPRPANLRGALRSAAYAAHESLLWPLRPPRDVDVIHYPADTGAVRSGRVPIVSTIHGLATLHMKGVRGPVADRVWRARVAALARVSARIITVSQSSARDIAEFAPGTARKIVVIPHGIDHAKFKPSTAADSQRLRKGLEVPGRYFFYAGNLDPRKNLLELAKAASKVYASTGVPLVVSGSPAWDSDEILSALRNTAGVLYLGRVDDETLVTLMQGAIAFCFPSSYEGFGFPVLEAMACGTPVLSSDRGSLKEVVEDAALVLASLDERTIAASMTELLRDDSLRSELRARGIENAARYSWPQSIQAHADVLRDAAA